MKQLMIYIFSLFVLVNTHAMAASEKEHAYLARIIEELNHLTPLIQQAQLHQDNNSRFQFNYPALIADITLITGQDHTLLANN